MKIYKQLIAVAVISWLIAMPIQIRAQTPKIQLDTLPRVQATLAALALLYSNVYIHELGHKYTAKWLTGAQSSISLGVFAGYTKFDPENWKILNKKPKATILALLAGPVAGFLAGLGVLGLGSLIDKNSFWRREMQSQGFALMLMNLSNLIPFRLFNFSSDGYRIWETYDQMQNNDFDKKDAVEKLSTGSPIDKFA